MRRSGVSNVVPCALVWLQITTVAAATAAATTTRRDLFLDLLDRHGAKEPLCISRLERRMDDHGDINGCMLYAEGEADAAASAIAALKTDDRLDLLFFFGATSDHRILINGLRSRRPRVFAMEMPVFVEMDRWSTTLNFSLQDNVVLYKETAAGFLLEEIYFIKATHRIKQVVYKYK